MDILVNVANQKLKIATNLKSLVSGTQEFVRFVFNLTDDWTGLTTFAQFMQNGVAYNQFLDEENSAYLPAEIEEGTCTVMLYGSNDNVIATTNYLTLAIDANILVEDAESTDISQSLYNQLITRINAIAGSSESDFADLQATDRSLQQQVNTKAAQTALTAEIARAQAAEQTNAANIALKANQAEMDTRLAAITNWNTTNKQNLEAIDTDLQNQINTKAAATALEAEIQRATRVETEHTNALLLKANQSQVDELDLKVTALENNEYIATLIGDAVAAEMEEYLESGALASLAILDGTVTRAKLNTDVETVLVKAEGAMQKSVYDPQNLGVDVFSYAQARADTVQRNLNTVISEIAASYQLTDTLVYTNLKDTIQGTLTLARNYAQALLADYKAFTITIVDELPATGQAQTFYLVPNNSNTGYDKYWWIIDDNNVAKWDVFGSSSTLVVTELPETGDEDVDYILKSAHGCIYYKYIDGDWQVVAGSLAYVAAALPSVAQGNEFTDYYVISQDSGNYVHYRFINGEYQVIGGDTYSKSALDTLLNSLDTRLTNATNTNAQNIQSNTTNITALGQAVNSIRDEVENLDVEGVTYFATYGTAILASGQEAQNVFTLWEVEDGVETVKSQFVIQGGGGGGQQTITNLVVERVTQSPLIITPSDKSLITIDFSSTDSDGESVDATYTWKLNNNVIMSGALTQGENTFDLSDYVSVGTQKFTLTVVDEGGSTVVKTWTIQMIDVRIETTYNDRYTNPIGRSVSFTYTPYGAITKTIHFKLDGVDDTITTSASGVLQSYTIEPQEHGSHMLEVWATATVNNTQVETAHIFKDIIWYDSEPTEGEYQDPVIGCIYRYDYYSYVTIRQYDTLAIVYNVYDPTTSFPTVYRYVDGDLDSTETITANQNVWNFKSDEVGTHELEIVCGDTSVEIKVKVIELGIDVSPITGGLEVDFNPTGITNSSDNRLWSNDNYHMTVSDNFDWANGGYKTDENGDTYFLVKAGTRATFDYMMFDGGLNGNPAIVGAEMKVIFMTENVQDKDAVWLSNVETTSTTIDDVTTVTNVGIQMSVHEGWLKTNNASSTDVESDTESIAATNTYLYMPYSEEDIIEMDININTIDRDVENPKAFIMAYEDGVPSKAYVYDSSDRLYQQNVKPIVIGSDYCDVRIYRLKLYSTSLTTENIMKNFIADSRDSTTMLQRYDRNSIYYNSETNKYTPYSGEGVLNPERLAAVVPNCKILMLDTDHFTTSKKTFVKSTLRCIHATGGTVYPGDPYYDNWYFENGYHAGQGTTSDNYGNSGRNVDFLFNCDGVHKPSDKVNAESNYISKLTIGYNTENAHTETVEDWMGDSAKVTLTRTSIPNNFFNLKVNIASSENVNNALLQKRYNDYLPYISPAKVRNPYTKNDMEFVPAILFIRENNEDITTHNEFKDTNWHKMRNCARETTSNIWRKPRSGQRLGRKYNNQKLTI